MRRYVIFLLAVILLIGIVCAAPPKVQLEVTPLSGTAPLTIMASEVSGDPAIVDWQFNFGDGSDPVTKTKSVQHTYTAPGEYTVWLGVVNEKGEEATDTAVVTVTGILPQPTKVPDGDTTVKIIYDGATPIKDALTSPSKTTSDTAILKEATNTVMSATIFPYNISSTELKTEIKIMKYRCDEKTLVCGYWIEAYRDGKEVATNSPIWIINPPLNVIVSETYDEKTNEVTVILKEDMKGAIEEMLWQYVDEQPEGKSVVGTKV